MDGREEGMKRRQRKKGGEGARRRPVTRCDPRTPATAGAFVQAQSSGRPPPCKTEPPPHKKPPPPPATLPRPSSSGSLECDKVRVQTLSGARGRVTENSRVGGDMVHICLCVTLRALLCACVCVCLCIGVYMIVWRVVQDLRSCNIITGLLFFFLKPLLLSQGLSLMQANGVFMFCQHSFSLVLPVCVCICVCVPAS